MSDQEKIKDEIGLPTSNDAKSATPSPTATATATATLTNTNNTTYPKFSDEAIRQAVSQMFPRELEMWNALVSKRVTFEDVVTKAPINWDRDFETAPTNKLRLRTARRRAEALNYIYQTDKAVAGHGVWYGKTYAVGWLDAVKVVARLIGAERDLKARKR